MDSLKESNPPATRRRRDADATPALLCRPGRFPEAPARAPEPASLARARRSWVHLCEKRTLAVWGDRYAAIRHLSRRSLVSMQRLLSAARRPRQLTSVCRRAKKTDRVFARPAPRRPLFSPAGAKLIRPAGPPLARAHAQNQSAAAAAAAAIASAHR